VPPRPTALCCASVGLRVPSRAQKGGSLVSAAVPHGKGLGFCVLVLGVAACTSAATNAEEQTPAVEPGPPVSSMVDAGDAEVVGTALDASQSDADAGVIQADAGDAEAGTVQLPVAPPCTPAQVAAFKGGAASVELSCSLTLKAGDVIKSDINISGAAASGVTLDCGGGTLGRNTAPITLVVRSLKQAGTWNRPEHVKVKNCVIKGNVRVYGLGQNGQSPAVKESSLSLGHTQRAQDAAPRDVVFDNVTIIEDAPTVALYLAPGVTHFSLLNSDVSGSGVAGPGVYFDAESADNRIENCALRVTTNSREQLAIDGSARNTILNNRFTVLDRGGIYLYRNCGEGGTVRHQTPSNNLIKGNTFTFGLFAILPAVWVASRNGLASYCGEDVGYPFGSSVSNLDLAINNTIADNIFKGGDPGALIRVDAQPNTVSGNK
jgi:hypothetical protein